MAKTFGPSYFQQIPRYGIGLGMNPADAHDIYLNHYPSLVNYIEVTATSSRHRGPYNYVEVRRMNKLPKGHHYWKLDDYPSHIKRIVHSTNVNPIYPDPISPEAYAELRRLVTLTKSPWVTEDLGIWLMSERHVYPFFLPLPLQKETLAVAIRNIHKFHEEVGVPFNAEFPPISVIAGDMHAFDFFRVLVEETGCGMCIDIGHVLSYQLERKVSPTADLHLLPWDYITEIHLAGGNIDLASDGFHYDDNHGDYDIVTVCFDMMDTVIHLAPNLRAITIEIFGSKQHQLSIDKMINLKSRESVRNWLEDKVATFRLPTFEEAEPKVRKAAVSMHDLLHNGNTISGATLLFSGKEFLDIFAAEEQRRWDYERRARIQLQGLNLSSFFPLTTKWLLLQREFSDEMNLYAAILKDLPGHTTTAWSKIRDAFKAFAQLRQCDKVLLELFNFEEWMNECVMDLTNERTQEFTINVLAIASHLNKDLPIDDEAIPLEQVTLVYTGNGQFGVVSNPVSIENEHPEPVSATIRGKKQCCTGE